MFCEVIGIGFFLNMMFWVCGGYLNDGVWVLYWYGVVWNFEIFVGVEGEMFEVLDVLLFVFDVVLFYYEKFVVVKL